MNDDHHVREEVRFFLSFVRGLIHSYSGLYAGENLTRDVLRLCDEMTTGEPDARVREARCIVEDRCTRLAQAADRFTERDPALIAAARSQAVAAIDLLQDAVVRWRKSRAPVPQFGKLLRQKSA